jgi:hypothetical protein
MEIRAREQWRAALEAWALPQPLLDAVPDSPYRCPRTAAELLRSGEPDAFTPTLTTVSELAGTGGSVIDIGAGWGRLSLPLSRKGHRVTAVERDGDLAAALADTIVREGARVTRIIGRWPDVAGNAGTHDVALISHVVYDVPALGPFLEAAHEAARRAVVIEATPRHPWSNLRKYYRLLHGLELPRKPTVDDLDEVVREVTGVEPAVRWWSAPAMPRFEDMSGLMDFYRRRLLVPADRSVEAAGYLEPDVEETGDGWLVLGPAEREVVTIWWRTRR